MKKILIALMSVVLCLGLVGGAFAYFTDVVDSEDNVMTAGTLSLEIRNQGGSFGAGPVTASFSGSDLAPGQTFETDWVQVKNTGSIDIPRVYVRFGDYSATVSGFGDKLTLAYYGTKIDGDEWVYQTFVDDPVFPDPDNDGDTTPDDGSIAGPEGSYNAQLYIDFWVGQGATNLHTGYITLADLVRVRKFGSGDKITSLLLLDYRSNPTDTWPSKSTLSFKLGILFDPTADNTYQGAECSFDMNFIGSQCLDYPDTTLSDYVNPGDLVP